MCYTVIGYMSAWLRAYYPKQYMKNCINVFSDDKNKVKELYGYINEFTDISLEKPVLGNAESEYSCGENNTIYEGLNAIKGLPKNDIVAIESYNKIKIKEFKDFILLNEINSNKIGDSSLLKLIGLNFFREFDMGQISMIELLNTVLSIKIKEGMSQQIKTLMKKVDTLNSYYESMDKNKYMNDFDLAICELEALQTTNIDIDTQGCILLWIVDHTFKYGRYNITAFNLGTKQSESWTSKEFVEKQCLVQLEKYEIKAKKKMVNGKWTTVENEFNKNIIKTIKIK